MGLGAFLSLFVLSGSVEAATVSELFAKALIDEPNYQGAAAGLRAAKARNRQTTGSLLPQITANGATNANRREYETRGLNLPQEQDKFNSHNWQVTATQPIWRYSQIADKKQSRALQAQAEYQLTSAEQILAAHLVENWLALLAARDQQDVVARQERAAQKQLQMLERGLQLGISGLPQREEALSKWMQAQSERLRAEAEFELKRAALEQLTGTMPDLTLPVWNGSTDRFPEDQWPLDQWLEAVKINNPDVLAALKAVDAAREDISKQFAAYMPSVDLVGNVSGNGQAVGGFPGQNGYDIRQSYVGLQANWTLFSSGAQTAKVREARAMLDKTEQSLENARRTAINNTKQVWYGGRIALARLKAMQQAVSSAKLALLTARKASGTGLKSELDILQSEHQVAEAEAEVLKAHYEWWTAHFKLSALAGKVSLTGLEELDRRFQPALASAAPLSDSPYPDTRTEQAP